MSGPRIINPDFFVDDQTTLRATLKVIGSGEERSFENARISSCGALVCGFGREFSIFLVGHAMQNEAMSGSLILRLLETCKELGAKKLEVEVAGLLMRLEQARTRRPDGLKSDGKKFNDWDVFETLNQAIDDDLLSIRNIEKSEGYNEQLKFASMAAKDGQDKAKSFCGADAVNYGNTLELWLNEKGPLVGDLR